MDRLIEALAEPWARWWSSQNVTAALAFWAAGVLGYLTRNPASSHCGSGEQGTWCRIQHAGALGAGLAVVLSAALVAGSALLVAAFSPWLIRLLSLASELRRWTRAGHRAR